MRTSPCRLPGSWLCSTAMGKQNACPALGFIAIHLPYDINSNSTVSKNSLVNLQKKILVGEGKGDKQKTST